jgi:hypothetical protein
VGRKVIVKIVLEKVYDHLRNLKTKEVEKDDKVNSEEQIFIEKPINELDKSCSTSCIKVFDFDKAKEKISKEFGRGTIPISHIKSCDALKISSQKCKFDLIEMKGIKEFIVHINSEPESKQYLDTITKKIEEYYKECIGKFKASIFLLNILLYHSNCSLTKNEKRKLDELSKDYYILSDYDLESNPREVFAVNLFALSHPGNSYNRAVISKESKETGLEIMARMMKETMKNVNEVDWNFNRPKVINSFELNIIYGEDTSTNIKAV